MLSNVVAFLGDRLRRYFILELRNGADTQFKRHVAWKDFGERAGDWRVIHVLPVESRTDHVAGR